MWEKLKSNLLGILSLISFLLLGAFLLEKKKNDKAELEIESEKLKGQDNVLKEQQKQNDQIINQEQQKIDALEKPEATDLNPQEATDYWNKKGNT